MHNPAVRGAPVRWFCSSGFQGALPPFLLVRDLALGRGGCLENTHTGFGSAGSKPNMSVSDVPMNIQVLIDSIVRQTTVLIAQLATAAGARAPLAHIANQVFVELVRELRSQGVSQKVIADMFGLALRTYQDKVRRVSESRTDNGRSLWSATLAYIEERGTVLRADVLNRFRSDEPASVRAVLRDLVESGLVFCSGRGESLTYRFASTEDHAVADSEAQQDRCRSFVRVALSRYAPATAREIAQCIPLDLAVVERALGELVESGEVRKVAAEPAPKYETHVCLIGLESPAGWEAAVFDHFQAMVTAVTAKLATGATYATRHDVIGGSTYAFTVWEGHPHRDEALGVLARARQEAVDLRQKIEAYNATQPFAQATWERITFYVGQSVLTQSEGNGELE